MTTILAFSRDQHLDEAYEIYKMDIVSVVRVTEARSKEESKKIIENSSLSPKPLHDGMQYPPGGRIYIYCS